MLNFKEAIVEYRYFDNNGAPVDDEVKASITIGRTEGNTFGDYWHAIDRQGYRIGAAKAVEDAVKLGSIETISDAAKLADVKIKRGDLSSGGIRYKQDVFVNGDHVATFMPNRWGQGYSLRDISGMSVHVQGEGLRHIRNAEVSLKFNMPVIVRQWLELIPTQDDIDERNRLKAEKQAREDAQDAEDARVELIKDNAEDLLGASQRLVKLLMGDEGFAGPEEFVIAVEYLGQVVDRANGKTK